MHVDTNETVVKTIWVCDYCQVEEFESYEDAVEHEAICQKRKRPKTNHIISVLKNKKDDVSKSYDSVVGTAESHRLREQETLVPPHRPHHDAKKSSSNSSNFSTHDTLATAVAPNTTTIRNPALDIIIPPPLTEPIPQGSSKPLDGSCFACDVCRSAYFRTFEEALLHENLCKQQRDRDLALAKYRGVKRKFLAQQMARKLKARQSIDERESGVAKGAQQNKRYTVQEVITGENIRNRNKEQHGSSTAVHAICLPTSPLTKTTLSKPKATNSCISMMQDSGADKDLAQLCKRTIDDLLKAKENYKSHKPQLEKGDQVVRWEDEKFSQRFQLLHPFYRDALRCVNIRTNTENHDGLVHNARQMVQMKCGFCSYKVHVYVKDVKDGKKNWQTALRRFVSVHVLEYCSSVPNDLKSILLKQKDRIEEENNSHSSQPCLLDTFCECVAILYNYLNEPCAAETDASVIASKNASPQQEESDGSSAASKRWKVTRQRKMKADIVKNQKRASRHVETMPNNEQNCSNTTPFGGVPLLCSVTLAKTKDLSDRQKILLSQLEFMQEELDAGQANNNNGLHPISLRCMNCHRRIVTLRSKNSLSRDILSTHAHFESCAFTPEKVAGAIRGAVQENSKSEMDHMESYCQFLSQVYGMCDEKISNGEQYVIFEN